MLVSGVIHLPKKIDAAFLICSALCMLSCGQFCIQGQVHSLQTTWWHLGTVRTKVGLVLRSTEILPMSHYVLLHNSRRVSAGFRWINLREKKNEIISAECLLPEMVPTCSGSLTIVKV